MLVVVMTEDCLAALSKYRVDDIVGVLEGRRRMQSVSHEGDVVNAACKYKRKTVSGTSHRQLWKNLTASHTGHSETVA